MLRTLRGESRVAVARKPMLLHQPIVMPNMVHVSNVAWLQTIRLEVVKVRLVVAMVMWLLHSLSTCSSIGISPAFTAVLHFTVKRRQDVEDWKRI